MKNTLEGLTRPCLLRSYSDLAYTKVLGVVSQYILWSGSLWYPLRSSMLKNKRIFSLAISKLIPAFSAVQLDVAKNHINWYVTKNNSRSLRGVKTRTTSIFRTPAYSQLWYIQNPAIFRTLAYSKCEAYTEPCHTSTMKLTNYNFFSKAWRVEINILM